MNREIVQVFADIPEPELDELFKSEVTIFDKIDRLVERFWERIFRRILGDNNSK